MRGFVINKILSFQYRLGRVVGKGKARSVCNILERGFVAGACPASPALWVGRGAQYNDKSLPGSPALCAESFTLFGREVCHDER